MANIAAGMGHTVAALRSFWTEPADAKILFGTPTDIMTAVRGAEIKLDGFDSVIVVGAESIERTGQSHDLTTILEQVKGGGLRAFRT